MKSPQKFTSVHAKVHNHFALERHLINRQSFKELRSTVLAEWQALVSQAAAYRERHASRSERFALD